MMRSWSVLPLLSAFIHAVLSDDHKRKPLLIISSSPLHLSYWHVLSPLDFLRSKLCFPSQATHDFIFFSIKSWKNELRLLYFSLQSSFLSHLSLPLSLLLFDVFPIHPYTRSTVDQLPPFNGIFVFISLSHPLFSAKSKSIILLILVMLLLYTTDGSSIYHRTGRESLIQDPLLTWFSFMSTFSFWYNHSVFPPLILFL